MTPLSVFQAAVNFKVHFTCVNNVRFYFEWIYILYLYFYFYLILLSNFILVSFLGHKIDAYRLFQTIFN